MNLKSSVALVTGSAVRIGRAIAEELARAGAHVVVHHWQHAEEAEEVARSLRELGARAVVARANLADAQEVAALFELVDREFGRLDALVNNAAIFRPTRFPDLSEQDWDDHLDLNLKGTFLCCREAARRMIPRRAGKIVNIADSFGDRPWPRHVAYCVSKAGVVTLTRVIARSLAKHNIQVNAVGPGAILFPDGYTQADIDAVLARSPAGRAGAPADVARAVRFLIEGPDYITGALIPVDGGASLT